MTGPIYNVWDLRPNVNRKPFDDLRVRQAVLGYGIDRPDIVKVAFGGRGQPSVSMLTPGMPGYNSLMERYPYNPQQAKALLKEAVYGSGNALQFTFLSPTIEPAFTNIPTLSSRAQALPPGSIPPRMAVSLPHLACCTVWP